MSAMSKCSQWVTHGFIGRDGATGHSCDEPVYEDKLCRRHFEQEQVALEQFRQQMDAATRHVSRTSVSGKGTYCGCGEFVPTGDNHPWGLSWKLEQAKEDEGLKPCPKCCYRFQMTSINVTCVFCEDGWVSA